jgi:hypothetical protein
VRCLDLLGYGESCVRVRVHPPGPGSEGRERGFVGWLRTCSSLVLARKRLLDRLSRLSRGNGAIVVSRIIGGLHRTS